MIIGILEIVTKYQTTSNVSTLTNQAISKETVHILISKSFLQAMTIQRKGKERIPLQ